MKKTKIFFGGYINFPNAQNINCDNIAKHLDKEKFEVHVMYSSKLPVDKKAYREAGIHLHRLIHHRFIWLLSKLFTLWWTNCDVYYLPKREKPDMIFAEINKGNVHKAFIASVEYVLTAEKSSSAERKRYLLDLMDSTFAISECIAQSARAFWGADMEVLPLGVAELAEPAEKKERVSNVIWVGNVKANKRPGYLIEIAARFPRLQFTMIGDGDMQEQIREEIARRNLKNVTFTGRIPNAQVYAHMRSHDLLLMTSEFEGLPKVIQEAAQCGLPSIYMAENYTVDFLEDGVNGYGVRSLDEMCRRLEQLIAAPERYRAMSAAAREIISRYTWENLIPKYEEYFLRRLEQKRNKV